MVRVNQKTKSLAQHILLQTVPTPCLEEMKLVQERLWLGQGAVFSFGYYNRVKKTYVSCLSFKRMQLSYLQSHKPYQDKRQKVTTI